MNKYELLLITPAKVSEKEIPQVSENIAKLISEQGAKVTLEDNLGRKKLAYPIAKNQVGNYLLFQFTGSADLAQKIKEALKLTPEIIRYQLVANPPSQEAKQGREKKEIPAKSQLKKEKVKPKDKERKINLEDLEEELDNILEDQII